MRYFSLILIFLVIAQMTMAQTLIKGPALIEGTVSTTTAAGTTTLTKDSQTNQTFVGATTQTVVLPDATTIPVGRRFYITNRSTGIVTVNTNGGALLATIAPDYQRTFIVKTVAVAAGTWDVSNVNVSGVTGVLPIANGGTNKALTLSAGGVPYFDADSFEVLSAGSAGQVLSSNGASAPSWTTATFPSSAGPTGTILRSNGTNWVASTPTYPNTATLGKIMIGDGTNWIESTPTYPNSATGTGTILRADGTNWVATTATFPSTTTINQILYSSANNVVGGITAAATSALVTNSSSVPAFTSGATPNRLLRTDGTTVSFSQAALTTDVTGVLPMANGGTNKNMTASAGAVVYSDADSQELTAVGNSGEVLRSNGTSAPAFATVSSLTTAPTIQRFTSGSGTYTTPAGVKYIIVTMVGGGGGGRGSGTASLGNGGNGGTSTFGTSLLTATGGNGNTGNNAPGGTVTINGPAVNIFGFSGGTGGAGQDTGALNTFSGSGGNSIFGGAGGSVVVTTAGVAAATNSGSGGGGGALTIASGINGGGGGAGGGLKAIISSPSSSYSYAVGAAGTAGTAGTSGAAGGAGGSGIVIVEEYYQ